MSDKTLNDIIKEEFTKLMSELDQKVISEKIYTIGGSAEGVEGPDMEVDFNDPAAVKRMAKRLRGATQDYSPGTSKRTRALAQKNLTGLVRAKTAWDASPPGEASKAKRVADDPATKARLKSIADTEQNLQALDVQSAAAAGAPPDAALRAGGVTADEYGDLRAQGRGAEMEEVPSELPATQGIAKVDRTGKRAVARRRRGRSRRRAAQKAIGGDYDKFYADLDAAGLGGMLDASGGRDKKFGKGHQAAFDALQAHKSKMSVPAEKSETAETWASDEYGPDAKPGEGNLLLDPDTRETKGYRTDQQSVALRPDKSPLAAKHGWEYESVGDAVGRGAPRPDFVEPEDNFATAMDRSDPMGMSQSAAEPEEGGPVAIKPAPPKRDDLYESKQYDRMKLLAGMKKKDK